MIQCGATLCESNYSRLKTKYRKGIKLTRFCNHTISIDKIYHIINTINHGKLHIKSYIFSDLIVELKGQFWWRYEKFVELKCSTWLEQLLCDTYFIRPKIIFDQRLRIKLQPQPCDYSMISQILCLSQKIP